jgi:hypothetical protein
MGSPSSTAPQQQTAASDTFTGQVSGGVQVPLIAKADAQAGFQSAKTDTDSTTSTQTRGGLARVVKEIAASDFVILIDDFHYMARDLQSDAALQLKTAAERGICIAVASVPHRSDDVVRANTELRGRTIRLDTKFWSVPELVGIPKVGFEKLSVHIEEVPRLDLRKRHAGLRN